MKSIQVVLTPLASGELKCFVWNEFRVQGLPLASGERTTCMEHFRTENGSSQGQSLALTGLCVPNSLDSGIDPTVNSRKGTHGRQVGFDP